MAEPVLSTRSGSTAFHKTVVQVALIDLRDLHNGRGTANQELAEVPGVSGIAVANHIKQLFARLDTHDRAEMVGKALGRVGK